MERGEKNPREFRAKMFVTDLGLSLLLSGCFLGFCFFSSSSHNQMLNVHVGFNNRILANLFRLVEGVELLKFCWHNLNYPCSFRALLIHSLVLIPVPTHCFCGCVIGQTLKIYNEKQSYMASKPCLYGHGQNIIDKVFPFSG